jgi:hypothetical protein
VAFGQWLLAPFWLVIAWQTPRMRTRWLWALPVGRRALLWTMIGPLLVANVLGYFAGFYLRQPVQPDSEPRVVVVALAAILAYVMLTILFCVLLDWRGFARIPRRIPMTVFSSFFMIWFLAILAGRYFGLYSDTWARDALGHFGRTVRLGLPALFATALAVLVALYWAIEKVFSEPDFADKPAVSRPDAWQ